MDGLWNEYWMGNTDEDIYFQIEALSFPDSSIQ